MNSRLLLLRKPAVWGAFLSAVIPFGSLHALPGLSPVWELVYNNNEPFSDTNPDHQPSADPDGDGWDNVRESIAGTDPFDANSPSGYLRPTISPHPWLAETFSISWDSRIGKNYQLQASPDFVAWVGVGDPIPGINDAVQIAVNPVNEDETFRERLFWRIQVSDQPTAGGLLTPWDLDILATRSSVTWPAGDGTGTGTGTEPNSDQSGPVDRLDASPHDDKIDWQKTADARYLRLSVDGETGGFKAVDVNGRGQILFSRIAQPTDYQTQPVGKIWDPSRAEGERLTDVFFKPEAFQLIMWKNVHADPVPDPDTRIFVESVPLPLVSDEFHNHRLSVSPRAISDDGSVMANVAYDYSEDEGAEGLLRYSPYNGHYVFYWKPGIYNACKLLGEARGYRNHTRARTGSHVAGFYTVNGEEGPVIHAAVYDQDSSELDPTTDLTVRSYAIVNGEAETAITLPGMTQRGQGPDLANQTHLHITHSGRTVIPHIVGNAFRYFVADEPLPEGTLPDSISDVPAGAAGPWGIGRSDQAFALWRGMDLEPATSAVGVLQFDATGTGIGNGYQNRHIWRNARWLSFAQVTGNSEGSFNDFAAKKITPGGIIWIANMAQTENALLVPVVVAELSPKVKDEEGNDIEGSEYPSIGRPLAPLTPFVELNPMTDRIAHRELKVRISEVLKGKTVTWTLDAVPGVIPDTIRGRWVHSATHPDRFEASSAYGANGFTRLSQESARSTVGNDGFTAIRVNVPPVGLNQVRIRIEVEGMESPLDLIDMEVPGVVVIDPGHGGSVNLSGSSSNNATSTSGVLEKSMALSYGLALRDSLRTIRDRDRLNLRIFMTREIDENITGSARAAVARDKGADVIQIIHFNASNSHTNRGTLEVYRTTSNAFPSQDTILSAGIITRMVAAMTPFDAGANHRARVVYEAAVASDQNNGNTAAYCPVRTSYVEVEFIDFGANTPTPDDDLVDILLNTGPNAAAVRAAVASAMAEGILHDLRTHQPQN